MFAGVKAATTYGPLILDGASGLADPIARTGFPNSVQGSGAMITSDGKYFIYGVSGGVAVVDLDTNTLVTPSPFSSAPGSTVWDIKQRKTDGMIAMAVNGPPYLVCYTYPGFVLVSGTPSMPSIANEVSFTDDGTKLCVGHSTIPNFSIFDTSTWANITPTLTSPPTAGNANGATMSRNGQYVLIYGTTTGNRRRIYNLLTGALMGTENSNDHTAGFTADSLFAYFENGSGVLRKFNLTTSVFSNVASMGLLNVGGSGGRSMEFTNDGIGFVMYRGVAFFFDTATDTLISQVQIESGTATPKAALFPTTSKRKLAGTVEDLSGNPVQRKIVAYDLATDRYLGETVSDVAGNFEMRIYSPALCYVVAEGQSGEQHKIYSNVSPVLP